MVGDTRPHQLNSRGQTFDFVHQSHVVGPTSLADVAVRKDSLAAAIDRERVVSLHKLLKTVQVGAALLHGIQFSMLSSHITCMQYSPTSPYQQWRNSTEIVEGAKQSYGEPKGHILFKL